MVFRKRSNKVSITFSNFSLFVLGGCFFLFFPSFSQKIHFQISQRAGKCWEVEGTSESFSGAMLQSFSEKMMPPLPRNLCELQSLNKTESRDLGVTDPCHLVELGIDFLCNRGRKT